MQHLKAMGSWVGVAMALSAVTACGDKGQLPGRGAAKPAASKPVVSKPLSALPKAFRRGKSAEELLKLMPALAPRRFATSLVIFRLREVLGAWGAVHQRLRADRFGRMVLRELAREARRGGVLLPTSLADAERWGINVDGPAFAMLSSYSRASVVGYSVRDAKALRRTLEQVYGRGTAPLAWERHLRGSADDKDLPVEVLKAGSSSRAFCHFPRGFAFCSRRHSALRELLHRASGRSLWADLEPAERSALPRQSALLCAADSYISLLSWWRLDGKRLYASGRMGGQRLGHSLAEVAKRLPPNRLAALRGKVATAWARFPVEVLTKALTKHHGVAGAAVFRALDGEIAAVEDAGGAAAVVLGLRNAKAARQLLANLLKQLEKDGPLSGWLGLRISARKRAQHARLGRYERFTLHSTEGSFKATLPLALVWGKERVVIGEPALALRVAAGNPRKLKDQGLVLMARSPIGDLFAPLAQSLPRLLKAAGAPIKRHEASFVRMVSGAFRDASVRLRIKGRWLHGEGSLQVVPGPKPYSAGASGALLRGGVVGFILAASRLERGSKANHDLMALRWWLMRYFRKHKRLPKRPKKGPWLPKVPCCKQPDGRCPRALDVGVFGEKGVTTYSRERQWRYWSNKAGTKATLETRADLDCDGRYSLFRVEFEVDANGKLSTSPYTIVKPYE